MKDGRTYVGFGFGAIQAGLFVYEAWRSGRFRRLVVAEVMPEVVAAVRAHKGLFALNVVTADGVGRHEVGPVDIFNPLVAEDRRCLVEALAEADEIGTALPSVACYSTQQPGNVADLLAEGLQRKSLDRALPASVVYTAENHNRAAEMLTDAVQSLSGIPLSVMRTEILNTVIGKMSGVVTDGCQLREQNLLPMTPCFERAFLVESFNRILIARIRMPGFQRGIEVFDEKDDLLPFEEAKLYGHNATHALIGYLLRERGATYMSDAASMPQLLEFARQAFLEESGGALCRKYGGLDPLFTRQGYHAYVDDLLTRMTNVHLRDTVERITRDTRRKLGWDDRLVGTMRLALANGIEPTRYAQGAAAAVRRLAAETATAPADVLDSLWTDHAAEPERQRMHSLVTAALCAQTGIQQSDRTRADCDPARPVHP